MIIVLLQRPHSVRRERDQHLHAGLCAEELLRGLQYQVTAGRRIYPLSFLTLPFFPRYLPTPSPLPSEADQKVVLPVPGFISSEEEEEEVVISGNLRKKTKSHLMMKQKKKVKL